MRRPLIFGVFFAAAICLSGQPRAQALDMRWEVLAEDERAIIDRLAADFYEDSLRQSQANAIEAHTSEIYTSANPDKRAHFREDRRTAWAHMSPAQRNALRGAKRPAYQNLAEEQKAPFRRIALDKLGAAGALDNDALAQALRNDI